ncbi:MAG: tRNA (adenosine(37)-N6)-threonylcarbamoyltransferase complex dimerization subunit type 1 TsaB [Melioribacteraceae bacterium]|nr:tRNA (adenosine(37)-N6)-threonylcarbamoyltransferase complex dimerization subunit type 1 TsaB [Melioribacteraceae bacterium]
MIPILSIETTGELCSAAVMLDAKTYVEKNIKMKHIHSEKLVLMIEDVLRESGLKVNDLKAVAVSLGPGSFTGLRIGMATAKGLAFGANIPIIPVPTFEALAFQINNYLPENIKFNIVNNVNIDEVYYGKFIADNKNAEYISELSLVKKSEIEGKLKADELVFGDFIKEGKNISSPNAISIAKWAVLFGENSATHDYDYLEPTYMKNFVAKVKK